MADLISLSVFMIGLVFSSFSSFFGFGLAHRIPDRFSEESRERPDRDEDGLDPGFSSPCPDTLFRRSLEPGTPRESFRIRLGLALPLALNVGEAFRDVIEGFNSCIASLDPSTFHFCRGDVISDSLSVDVLPDARLLPSLFDADDPAVDPEPPLSGLALMVLMVVVCLSVCLSVCRYSSLSLSCRFSLTRSFCLSVSVSVFSLFLQIADITALISRVRYHVL